MIQENPSLVIHEPISRNSVSWRCPSNLAIVKYWGKYGTQYPRNPSLSLTLENSYTETTIQYRSREKGETATSFIFEGIENVAFKKRIDGFLKSIIGYFPFLPQLRLDIESKNSFPHSSGIASSASSMAAMAMGLCQIEQNIFSSLTSDELLIKASFIARLGSGSACRSVFSKAAIWGRHPDIKNSSNDYAIGWDSEIHPVFESFHDDILIVSPDEKSVSSTAGHALMEGNVYAEARYQQAHDRMLLLIKAMREGDVNTFGKIAEDEAMTLHALMMCSEPSYMLIEPGSIAIMKKVRAFRKANNVPVFFSLDAGPNIHLLYPDKFVSQVEVLIQEELVDHCHNRRIIKDQVGSGPISL